jgi:hypothetical protein
VNDDVNRRISQRAEAPAQTQTSMTIAARIGSDPLIRSCAYGRPENPTTVNQPITPTAGAMTGSATSDMTTTTAAAAISTHDGGNRPPSPAAAAPITSIAAKDSGSANGAASPRAAGASFIAAGASFISE